MSLAPPIPTKLASSLFQSTPAEVLRVTKLTDLETLFSLRLEHGQPLGHAPGQFVQLSIPGIGECPISICSSPTRGPNFEICVRKVGMVTAHLHRLKQGDWLDVRGPYGHGFDTDPMRDHNLVVVAGGCGLAPLRSLIHYVFDNRDRFGDFFVLYGARSPRDLLFRDELLRWSKRGDVTVLLTVDDADSAWDCRIGRVTALFTDLPRLDPQRTIAAIVGPPIMFKFAVIESLARGIPQKNIVCSLERRMKCGVGKCGHCQASGVYTCVSGPVFTYAELMNIPEAME